MAYTVEFKNSGKKLVWDDQYESILEMAGDNGIEIESDCEQGFCGTCAVKLVSGEVDMETTDGLEDDELENNMILACVAVPKSDLVIEA